MKRREGKAYACILPIYLYSPVFLKGIATEEELPILPVQKTPLCIFNPSPSASHAHI